MEGDRIREEFLRFFEERGHKRVPSSSLIPPPESGLLLTNAGMNQFIPYFLGQADAPYPRAATAQKVMRTNDIELVTEGYGIDHDLLWVTVFEEDEASVEAWTQIAGVAPERIVRRGMVDANGELANYWHTHTAGPGGPCS